LVVLKEKPQQRALPSQGIKKLAIRSGLWSLGAYGVTQVIRLAGNVVLRGFLSKDFFGLMVPVNSILVGLEMFSDVGVRPSVIRSENGEDPEFLDTAWTIQVIRGLFLWFICCCLALPLAYFYGRHELYWIFVFIGSVPTLLSSQSAGELLLERRLETPKISILQLSAQIFGVAVMLAWAYVAPSIWALVAGNIAGALGALVFSYVFAPHRPRLHINTAVLQEIGSFGRWVMASSGTNFLASQADRLLLPRVFDFGTVGVYSAALALASVPQAAVSRLSNGVIFPIASRYASLPRDEFRAKVTHHRYKPLLLAVGGLSLLIAFGDIPIYILFDDSYLDATWMLPALALGLWPRLLNETLLPQLLAIGKPQYSTYGSICKFAYTLLTLLMFVPWVMDWIYPLVGERVGDVETFRTVLVIISIVLNDLPVYACMYWGLRREQLTAFQQDTILSMLLIVTTCGLVIVRHSLGFGTPLDALF